MRSTRLAATLAAAAWVAGGLLVAAQAAPVTVIATLTSKPGEESALKDILVPLAESSRHEPGCVSYILLQNDSRPGQFFTYEIWSSKAAIDAHMKAPGIVGATPKLQGVLGEAPSQTFLTPVS